MTSVLVKRPVAFRIPRADEGGIKMSSTEWRYFNDEAAAEAEAEALGVDYQGLYVRDGKAIIAAWEPMATAPKDGTDIIVYRPIFDGTYIPQVGVDYWSKRLECWAKSRADTPPVAWQSMPARHLLWLAAAPPHFLRRTANISVDKSRINSKFVSA